MTFRFSSRPSILVLLATCCPTDIARFVITVIVDSVNRMLIGWPSSYIAQEMLVAGSPATADGNISPAVESEAFNFWVETPSQHSSPRTILGSVWLGAPRIAMFQLGIALKASAAVSSAVSEFCASYRFGLAAVAKAQPSRLLVRGQIVGSVQNEKPTKPLSRHVSDWHRHLSREDTRYAIG